MVIIRSFKPCIFTLCFLFPSIGASTAAAVAASYKSKPVLNLSLAFATRCNFIRLGSLFGIILLAVVVAVVVTVITIMVIIIMIAMV